MRYRSRRVGRLGQWAAQLHTGLLVSGATQEHYDVAWDALSYPTVTVYGAVFQTASDTRGSTSSGNAVLRSTSYNPALATPARLARVWFGRRSRFALDYYLLLRVLRWFSSPGSLHKGVFQRNTGCPIRKSRDQSVRAAPPRLSWLRHVLHRHAAPRHPPSAHSVFPIAPAALGTRRGCHHRLSAMVTEMMSCHNLHL